MTTYRSRYKQRLRRLRAALATAWVIQFAGHAVTTLGGAVGGVGIGLGQGELVIMAGCLAVLGLSLATGAERLSERWRGDQAD